MTARGAARDRKAGREAAQRVIGRLDPAGQRAVLEAVAGGGNRAAVRSVIKQHTGSGAGDRALGALLKDSRRALRSMGLNVPLDTRRPVPQGLLDDKGRIIDPDHWTNKQAQGRRIPPSKRPPPPSDTFEMVTTAEIKLTRGGDEIGLTQWKTFKTGLGHDPLIKQIATAGDKYGSGMTIETPKDQPSVDALPAKGWRRGVVRPAADFIRGQFRRYRRGRAARSRSTRRPQPR